MVQHSRAVQRMLAFYDLSASDFPQVRSFRYIQDQASYSRILTSR